jgi:hypothetical protein
MKKSVATLFTQQHIRGIWHNGRLYYSVIDCIRAFTLSREPSRQWWRL